MALRADDNDDNFIVRITILLAGSGKESNSRLGKKGHLERVCSQKGNAGTQKSGIFRANGHRDQFDKRVQLVDQEEFDDDEGNYTELKLEGDEKNSKPYYMEGFINGNRFKTMINSRSLVTILALDQVRNIMKRDKLKVAEMIQGDINVDFKENR